MPLSTIATAAVSTAIPNIIDKLVLPALKRAASSIKKEYQLEIEPLSTHLGKYLKRVYKNNIYLNTLVFHNKQKQ